MSGKGISKWKPSTWALVNETKRDSQPLTVKETKWDFQTLTVKGTIEVRDRLRAIEPEKSRIEVKNGKPTFFCLHYKKRLDFKDLENKKCLIKACPYLTTLDKTTYFMFPKA